MTEEKLVAQEPTLVENQESIDNIGEIDLPSFDCKPYIGKVVEINTVELKTDGIYEPYFFVETLKVAEFGGKPVTATKMLGLQRDAKGKLGWGAETQTGLFLKSMNVSHPTELVGKKVILQTKLVTQGKNKGKVFFDF